MTGHEIVLMIREFAHHGDYLDLSPDGVKKLANVIDVFLEIERIARQHDQQALLALFDRLDDIRSAPKASA